MKSQGHLRYCPLPKLFEVFTNRAATGCLTIQFEPEPALLYFNKGQLVDARLAQLQGFAAVHVALSRDDAPFDFDDSVAGREVAINDENERLMVGRVFPRNVQPAWRTARMPAQEPAPPPEAPPVTEPEKISEVPPASSSWRRNLLASSWRRNLLASSWRRNLLASSWKGNLLASLRRQLSSLMTKLQPGTHKYLPSRTLLREAAAILLIAVPAAVGLTLYGKRNEVPVAGATQTNVVLEPSSVAPPREMVVPQPTPVLTEITRSTDIKKITAPAPEKPATAAPEKSPKLEPKERVVESRQPTSSEPKIIEEVQTNSAPVTESPARTATPVTQETSGGASNSRTILVVVRIESGHVAEAWVKNSRNGLEAYEATALRLARQRRYAKDVSRTETVPVSVTINQ